MNEFRPIRNRLSIAPSRGQSMTEIAIILPILVLVTAGVLDLGRFAFAAITVTNAAREGARYGASHPCYNSCSAIQARARNEAIGSPIDPSQLNVSSSLTSATCLLGNPITVTVSYSFTFITQIVVGGGTIPIQASHQTPVFGTCP